MLLVNRYYFQYCQKIVVFSQDNLQVLLAKRKGENDFDGIFSFIGGKMENTDNGLVEGMKREKNEELGQTCRLKLYPVYNVARYFIKKDGSYMVLPHYYAKYMGGDIILNEEYSEYKWVSIKELGNFEPKIANIPSTVGSLVCLTPMMKESEFIDI